MESLRGLTLLLVAANLNGAPHNRYGVVRSLYCNARWLVRGIGSELMTNICGRGGESWVTAFERGQFFVAPALKTNAFAVVTGATSGIGTEIASGLAACGYHVIIAARDQKKGMRLVEKLGKVGGKATFVQWHADDVRSAAKVAAAIGSRPCAILVNNAGIMGAQRDEVVRTNLIAPTALTLALLPALRKHRAPRVVNVGSSSHLRASKVDPSILALTENDSDLSAYAQSKLGLMQVSTLLRRALPWLSVVDVHPGLVWTPMLKQHCRKLVPALETTRLARLFFKTPQCAATTVLVAALCPDVAGPVDSVSAKSFDNKGNPRQVYVVNQRIGGFASSQSRDEAKAWSMWKALIAPELQDVVVSFQVVSKSLATQFEEK